ncbi:MAG: YkgJ family cysteine cluster protein [Dehalococcoidia bacterium]|nr:YkgJ family cysteine cluster protein [Dehalococcoidia bacterium]
MTADRYAASVLEAELEAIYASLPAIDCQKRCHGSCGPIVMSALEWDRVTSVHGEHTCDDDLVCPHLRRESGLCGAYQVRPLICRLWGATESLRCEFGCVPDRVLSDPEVAALVERVQALSVGRSPLVRTVWPEGWQRHLEAARG